MIRRIGHREWEEIKQSEDKGNERNIRIRGLQTENNRYNKETSKYYLEKENIEQQETETKQFRKTKYREL